MCRATCALYLRVFQSPVCQPAPSHAVTDFPKCSDITKDAIVNPSKMIVPGLETLNRRPMAEAGCSEAKNARVSPCHTNFPFETFCEILVIGTLLLLHFIRYACYEVYACKILFVGG